MKTMKVLIILLLMTLFSCKKESGTDPVIETTQAKSIAASLCYAKATITQRGSYEIFDHGFVLSPNSSNFGIETGAYKISLKAEPMKADTFSTSFPFSNYSTQTLYVRSYLTNSRGTVYGAPVSFKPLLLSIVSLLPSSGKVGDKVTITGDNFSSTLASNIVKFNTTAAKVVEASPFRLVVEVPSGITWNYYDSYVTVNVTVGGQTVSSSFTILPVFTGFSPVSGTFGTIVTINGQNFSSGMTVKCNDILATINSSSTTSLSFYLPANVTTEKFSIKVIKNGVENTVPGEFTMNPLTVTSITPAKGYPGSSVTITGTNFNTGYNINKVKIGDVTTTISNVYQNTFSMIVPSSLPEGLKTVEVSNGVSTVVLNDAFNVVIPKITSFTPASGYYGSEITLSGENLMGNVYASLANYSCELTLVNSSTVKIKVPAGPPSGDNKLKITANNAVIYDSGFTVLSPVITGFSPSSGTPGTEVIINGSGFTNYSTVRFGTINTSVISTSPTQIKAAVPSNAGTGAMKITVVTGGCTSISNNDFTITN
jgi:hypothetical protein